MFSLRHTSEKRIYFHECIDPAANCDNNRNGYCIVQYCPACKKMIIIEEEEERELKNDYS